MEGKTWRNIKAQDLQGSSYMAIQNYSVFGFRPSFGILKKIENITFRKLDLFPFSGEVETPLFWVSQKHSRCLPPYLRMETDPVSETLFSLFFRIPDDGESYKKQQFCYTPSSESFRIKICGEFILTDDPHKNGNIERRRRTGH
jgi:hypothetical protein